MKEKTYQGKKLEQKPLLKQLREQVRAIREGDSSGKRCTPYTNGRQGGLPQLHNQMADSSINHHQRAIILP